MLHNTAPRPTVPRPHMRAELPRHVAAHGEVVRRAWLARQWHARSGVQILSAPPPQKRRSTDRIAPASAASRSVITTRSRTCVPGMGTVLVQFGQLGPGHRQPVDPAVVPDRQASGHTRDSVAATRPAEPQLLSAAAAQRGRQSRNGAIVHHGRQPGRRRYTTDQSSNPRLQSGSRRRDADTAAALARPPRDRRWSASGRYCGFERLGWSCSVGGGVIALSC